MSTTAIPPISTPTTSSSTTSSSGTNGLNLQASDFINMMVTQLQNQDPLQPTDSSQLLAQMSQIGQLQASTQLQTTLTTLMSQSQLANAGAMIGKSVQGLDSQGNQIAGVVNSVSVKSDGIYLNLDNSQQLSMSQVTTINAAPTAAATTGATTASTTTPTAAAAAS